MTAVKKRRPGSPRTFDDTGRKHATKITVSDHAVLRYLERFCDVDVKAVRDAISVTLEPIVEAGASSYAVNGMRFEIRDKVVTTVYPTEGD